MQAAFPLYGISFIPNLTPNTIPEPFVLKQTLEIMFSQNKKYEKQTSDFKSQSWENVGH
jgi:hypothetical protein